MLLGLSAVVLAGGLGQVLANQRRLVQRLRRAGESLSEEGLATGSGLAGATALIEGGVERSRRRLQEAAMIEARLSRVLALIPQGVAVFDAAGTVVFRNEAAEHFTGYPGDALVEEALTTLAQVAAGPEPEAPLRRTLDLFGPPQRSVSLQAWPLLQDEHLTGVLVVIDDFTERRRLEAVRRDFVANISHELKTPVGALALLTETLLSEEDPVVAQRLAERLLKEAFRVSHTIDDLLELSRIEAEDEPKRDVVAVRVFIAEAVERVGPAAEQRGVMIEAAEIDPSLCVSGDRRQLVSAVYNLLENAVKYSEQGCAVQVEARVDEGWMRISVEDHGIGIPRRDLEHVFERFYRVDSGRSRDTGGTGLGLAIVRHVADNHRGRVVAESLEGEGTVVTLRLPVLAGSDVS
ncbi:MAG: PAS domain-containing protein [Acidimicrobiia bacterium]|nr:PAS domain-containing protein [Acidimicrobiia bacterium]